MPKREDIDSVLIIGAGPIVIGQACEFDYSGAQACKALREEGYRVILVNSNPATIMTDPETADAIYIEPISWQTVERIIDRERPSAVLPTMGGQTALNCALDLHTHGVLARYGCELIGASPDAITKAENRALFKAAMERIGLACARSGTAHSMDEAWTVGRELGYPLIIRPSFTLGGTGGGVARTDAEFSEVCQRGLAESPTSELLIEESLLGWKEFEMEVVRDARDNCIIVCSIENFDPMGVHTGDSITVAPAQTLTDKEYQRMRDAAIAVLREIGVETGGSNVQFAVNPDNGRLIVIEMNPRVSRSSALASKATGFPIARVASKLAVGYTLDELRNEITVGAIPASFEPTIDYVVTKVPRFAFEKVPGAPDRLTTQMKSVGEVMAIGRTFCESFQKALRGLEIGVDGLQRRSTDRVVIAEQLRNPGAERIFYVGDAFACGMTIAAVHGLTDIDPWFLAQIKLLVDTEAWMSDQRLDDLDRDVLYALKQQGFADRRLATLLGTTEEVVRGRRHELGVRPVYKRVDTCAAEFATETAYLYSTYDEESEANPTQRRKVLVLGGGPNRIGQGIEFDYCCVHASMALRADGYETIMVNCNPETVSTDFDTSDRLYFEPLTVEDVLEIVEVEQPVGVIVQYGGQTPLRLAAALSAAGVPIVGTSPDMIDAAEDRQRFAALLHELGLLQPLNRTARTEAEAVALADEIGYPLVVRPSYVLGGRAMEIVGEPADLQRYMCQAVTLSGDSPVLLDRFLDDAIEVDVDCMCDGHRVVIAGVMQHIEPAGVHSGDSACSLPPYSLAPSTVDLLRRQTVTLALGLHVVGLMNVQYAIQHIAGKDVIYVLEANPRASRTVPYVSKATGMPVAKIAARCMLGQSLDDQGVQGEVIPGYVTVKEAVLPFSKFPGVDPVLSPEMKSTGEVMGIGRTFGEAFAKAQLGARGSLPTHGQALIGVRERDRARAVEVARHLADRGFTIVIANSTGSTSLAADLKAAGVSVTVIPDELALQLVHDGEMALVIHTVDQDRAAIVRSSAVRVAALAARVPLYTTIAGAEAVTEAIGHLNDIEVIDLQSLHRTAVTTAPLNLFIRQPFTESDDAEQQMIAQVMSVIDSANGMPRPFNYLTGLKAESATTFKPAFEAATGQHFTPQAFRTHRLELLKRADAFVNIRVGMSESSAFEIAYHIFAGRRTPMLFLVWRNAPIKTTLLREMQDLCEVTYLEFDHADELADGVREFFGRLAAAPGVPRSEGHPRSVRDLEQIHEAVPPDRPQPYDWTERGNLHGVLAGPADGPSISPSRPANDASRGREVRAVRRQ
jgi:carbamoyl-phosphate synthase large subunit